MTSRWLGTRSALFRPLAALSVVLAGCESRHIRVDMQLGGEGASRAFASNTLGKSDLERLKDVYATEPEADEATGGQRFAATFGTGLPSEVGNRNGTSAITTRLGTTRFYFETFAERTHEWQSLKQRIDAGELWTRLFGRWAERGIRDESKREEWARFVDGTLVPLASQLALMWGANSASAQALKVEQGIRKDDDRSPMTEEERLLARLSLPMLLAIADAGILTSEEAHRLLLVGADANATKAERDWVVEQIGKPAILRVVQRFRPETTSLGNVGWTALALNFWLWVQTSPERNDLLLSSPAISEKDKESLRAGKSSVTIPPPFGLDPMSGPTKTETEVRLTTGERPFLTNGEWLAESNSVRFRHGFVAAARRPTLTPPYFFAAWSEPDAPVQTKLFGAVLLSGAALADYGMWFESLPKSSRIRWEKALDRLEAEGRADDLRALREEWRAERPIPPALASWLDAPKA
jgi:hypothetical protein